MSWSEDNAWESSWWGNCCNTLGEKFKQMAYLTKMGLAWETNPHDGNTIYLKIQNISVIDIGGGPDSVLLQTRNIRGTVVDPCVYPEWTKQRYETAGIKLLQIKAEDLDISDPSLRFDEAWIYNCLQHVEDPERIAKNVLEIAKTIRIIEPIDLQASKGHPQVLTQDRLESMFNSKGFVSEMNENGFTCRAFYGVFRGNYGRK